MIEKFRWEYIQKLIAKLFNFTPVTGVKLNTLDIVYLSSSNSSTALKNLKSIKTNSRESCRQILTSIVAQLDDCENEDSLFSKSVQFRPSLPYCL